MAKNSKFKNKQKFVKLLKCIKTHARILPLLQYLMSTFASFKRQKFEIEQDI